MKIEIRKACREDAAEIIGLIKELAVFEKQPNAVITSEIDILENAFSTHPLIYIYIAASDDQILGMALFFYSFSTWKGKSIHLEDLIVKERYRGHGIGKKLMRKVVEIAYEEGLERMDWEVLDWNTNAIKFYKSLHTSFFEDWHLCRIYKEDIKKIIEASDSPLIPK